MTVADLMVAGFLGKCQDKWQQQLNNDACHQNTPILTKEDLAKPYNWIGGAVLAVRACMQGES